MWTIKSKYVVSFLQLFGWGLILGLSFYWSVTSQSNSIELFRFSMFLVNVVPLLLIYIVNSLLFIPNYLFRDKKLGFLSLNTLLVALLLLFSYFATQGNLFDSLRPESMPPRPKKDLLFLAKDLISYVLMIGFVTSLKLITRLHQSEKALKEAENARIKAELDNLRSQINPHFLLNTLNNIYALTVIDTDKAQKTIKELSLLLRYVLYDNLSERVLLIKEVEFLSNYIELMRIRLTNMVELKVTFDVAPESSTEIAPLLFISLIENAFKHGVSGEKASFIHIHMADIRESGEVTVSIKNSNNAKSESDKSGGGIGLDQVRRRLELQYPDAYSWQITENNEVYESYLVLKTKRM